MPHLSRNLVAWYHRAGRHDLPWQVNKTPYRVWISEIMLQQTQVATVIPYYQKFMKRFPTLDDLAKAHPDDVLLYWAGLGYYSRARNLHKAAQILINDYKGIFPNTVSELEKLPGIGRSTAGAIISFSMQIPAVILDGNVKRVLTRYFAVDGWPGKKAVHDQLWLIAERETPNKDPHYYNQAIMDLGASLCSRSKPQCQLCPLSKKCQAHNSNRVSEFPGKKPKKNTPFPEKDIQMLIIQNDSDETLLYQRESYGIWGGLWSLPECELDDDISTIIKQRFNLTIKSEQKLKPFTHKFSHYQLNINPVQIVVKQSKKQPDLAQQENSQWLSATQQKQVGVPAPVARLLKKN